MAERSIEELAADDRREMYRLNGISHVAHNIHNERDRCIFSVRRQQVFLDGLSDPGFQHFISDMLQEGDGGYRPDMQFDGSQVHLDLNKPVSGPSHVFMALGGTPPSAAHVPGESWEIPFMEPARLPTPPASPAPAEQSNEPAARGRARRAPSR
ncbi:hypothetical protein PIB30_019620 [Stylosanthes scabra]|uniref:Uncharacterized protein n=1 Tax=Stylosanthes scabra TaxID=79078 RepID=A0ABU6R8K7_9FABA|nr:hypothetical protein [Stylosanthes scabra]